MTRSALRESSIGPCSRNPSRRGVVALVLEPVLVQHPAHRDVERAARAVRRATRPSNPPPLDAAVVLTKKGTRDGRRPRPDWRRRRCGCRRDARSARRRRRSNRRSRRCPPRPPPEPTAPATCCGNAGIEHIGGAEMLQHRLVLQDQRAIAADGDGVAAAHPDRLGDGDGNRKHLGAEQKPERCDPQFEHPLLAPVYHCGPFLR